MKKKIVAVMLAVLMTVISMDVTAVAVDQGNIELPVVDIDYEIQEVSYEDSEQDVLEEEYANNSKGKCGDNVTWTLDKAGGTLTISGTGAMWDYSPHNIYDENKTPSYDWDFTKLEIKNGVTHLGNYAFDQCSNCTEVDLSENSSLKTIGNYAFSGCKGITAISLPSTVTSIEEGAFADCSGLYFVELPEGLVSIGKEVFVRCYGGTYPNEKTLSLNIPSTVRYLGEAAFSQSGIEEAVIPKGITVLEKNLFKSCNHLTKVILPEGLEKIGYGVFSSSRYLESVTIPDSVTEIGEYAFYYNFEMKELYIPASVTSFSISNSINCGFESIIVDPENKVYDSRDGCNAVIETSTGRLIAGCKNTEIPVGVKSIEKNAFNRCSIETIKIPTGVKSIGEWAFCECDYLSTVYIPSSVTEISNYAFQNCRELTDVYYEGSEEDWNAINIGEKYNEHLLNAEIHFQGGNASSHKCGPNSKWSISDEDILVISGTGYMFDFIYDDGEDGEVTIPWWDYHTQIKKVVIKDGITNIGDSSFIHHYDLAEVHIPTSVTEIHDSAFYATFVKDIYYDGTKAQWNKIKIGEENESIQNSIMHFAEEPVASEWPKDISFSYCNTQFDFRWSPSVLLDSKDVVDKNLAQISLILSAYSEYSADDAKTKIDESLETLGLLSETTDVSSDVTLRRWHVSYGDSKKDNRSAAHTIALNEYKDGNKTYKIVTVICRGTQMSEFAEDVALDLQNEGFVESAWNTYIDLSGFLANNDVSVSDRDVRYYIVGHSLGAATANLLTSYLISAGCYSNDITCYTYACPFTTWGYDNAHRNSGNAMNFIKSDDAVTIVSNDYVSFVNNVADTINNGNPFYWMLEDLGIYTPKDYKAMRFGFDIYLGNVTPKAKEYYKAYTGFSFDSIRWESRDFRDHRCETYMAFLQASIDDGNFARMQNNMVGNRHLSIYCPVNVNVIDNKTGKEVVTIENNRITSLLDDNIEAIVVGDKKFISLPQGSDYQVLLNGTGEGLLRYVVQEQKEVPEGAVLDNTVTFENVSIQLGKEFTSRVNDDIHSEDIRLLVLDENNLANKEVLKNGQEVKYNRFGDVFETDVPDDGTIPDGIWVAGVTDMVFTGKSLIQDFRVYDGTTMLTPKTDYTVKYKNNKKAYTIADPNNLTATDIKKAPQIIITMKGNYSGKETVYFSINPTGENPAKTDIKPYSITGDKISITDTSGNSNLSAVYDKSGAKPSIRVMYEDTVLKEGKDYTLKYSGNTKYPASKASVTITGKGNYTSMKTIPITVTQRPFSEGAGITVVATDKAEGKKAGQYTTAVKVFDSEGKLLKAGTDYEKKIIYLKDGVELTKTDYPKAGDEITVRVTGKGGYTKGFIDTTYNIVSAGQVNDISKATIKIKNQTYNKGKVITITDQSMFSQAYIGKNKSPLTLSTDGGVTGDFMVVPGSYSKNTNKGTAKVTFMGINGYTGTKTVSFSIGTRSLKDIWFGWIR